MARCNCSPICPVCLTGPCDCTCTEADKAAFRAAATIPPKDESAVPVYWIYDLGHWYLATKDAYDSWPTEKSKKLYDRPPAQAAQAEDWRIGMFERWRKAAQEKGYAGIAEAITAAPTAATPSPADNILLDFK